MSWTRALHLTQWADTEDARSQLPLLIRRLVRRTVPSLVSLNFPAWEQNRRRGFDGEVEAREGNQYVPAGRSAWEMGANKHPQPKAEGDFRKRTEETPPEEQARLAFVFVTPRVWETKDEWAKEKAATSAWGSVLVHDVNDLEHWLETAADVDAWFARLSGRAPTGVQDLEAYWSGVRSIAEQPLSESVFTASREDEAAAVAEWLAGAPGSFFMRTSGLSDGLDFLAALGSRPDQDRLRNGLIVYTVDAWRELAARRESLLLIAAPTLELQASDTAAAVAAGHFVFLSGPRGNITSGPAQILRRQNHYSIREALVASGFSDAKARQRAIACCGSSSILKRLITQHPSSDFPQWSQEPARSALAPFALVGGWTHVDPNPPPRDPKLARFGSDPPIDVLVVSALAGCNHDDLEKLIAPWHGGPEPLFVRIGSSVLIASREDAWHLLGGAITAQQFERFRDFAALVLEEDNPAFELAPDQRWMANLYGKRHSISEDLRRSIVESLALMATYPTVDDPAPDVDLKATVRSVLERTLYPGAKWQRWASFGENLTTLAEADPDYFLERVEEDLASAEPEVPKLFQDRSSGFFSGGALPTDLLWALEGLAWTRDHLSRAAVCLARLAARDPGGTYGNRPANSLREIFLLWLPHTNAPIADRLAALADVIEAESQVGWRLLKDLLPSAASSISHITHLPRCRPWADGWSSEKGRADTSEYAEAVADLILQAAGLDANRWSEAVEGMLRFGPEIRRKVFKALENVSGATQSSEATFALWSSLRQLVSRHEHYADAQWAFPEPIRARLSRIRDRLAPADVILKNLWLFGLRVELPGFDIANDYQAHERAVYSARLTALQEIKRQSGAEGVLRLVELGGHASSIGWLVGRERLFEWQDVGLPAILHASDEPRRAFISAYVRSSFDVRGWGFVNGLPIDQWAPHQIAAFARCLPFGHEVWDWIKSYGRPTQDEYWRIASHYLHEPSIEEIQTATRGFLDIGRAFTAIHVLSFALLHKVALPSDLIAEVLEAASSERNSEPPSANGDVHYAVGQLIGYLQKEKLFDRVRLAAIEWRFLSLLDSHSSAVGPATLMEAVRSEPQFFVELLKAVYRGRNEAPGDEKLSEQEQLRARQARAFLESLSVLPGTVDKGTFDMAFLRQWTDQVREIARQCDRIEVCDLTLGGLIARGTKKQDEDWPSAEIANLMEDVGTPELFSGFVSGVLNSRGVVGRNPFAGGDLERDLVVRYELLAQKVRKNGGLLADAFLRIARHYDSYARHEDDRAERDRLGR